MNKLFISFALIFVFLTNCSNKNNQTLNNKMENSTQNSKLDTATLGAGCFWCVEAIFSSLKGVESVLPGYSGGTLKNPDYKSVCTDNTGHAEVCQIYFDPEIIKFDEILEIFWTTHDPTTLNRQGNDLGTQYRSAIFYHNEEQKAIAEKSKREVATKIWDNPIVTEIVKFEEFYKAEDYHQDYFENNPNQGYCKMIIEPKVLKFRKIYKDKLK
jgi:peptide-methionine (S)-S-oxide reductase